MNTIFVLFVYLRGFATGVLLILGGDKVDIQHRAHRISAVSAARSRSCRGAGK
jgi:hypothetical protein